MALIPIPYFDDNYAFLYCYDNHRIIFDAGDSAAILDVFNRRTDTPTALFLTHHHHDHDGGVQALTRAFPHMVVISPKDVFAETIGSSYAGAIIPLTTPGHTIDHCCYYLPRENACITGDTLFAGSCGRCFTKDFQKLCTSLNQLSMLPEETAFFGAHEYLSETMRFLEQYHPASLPFYSQRIRSLKYPSLGITLQEELQYNPFLFAAHEGKCKEFTKLRQLKDAF